MTGKTGRQNVLLLLQRERAGQLRGVPLLAPVLESLKQLGRFTDAELTAADSRHVHSVYHQRGSVQRNSLGEMLPQEVQVDTPDKNQRGTGSGAFIDLNPGEKVEFADPKHPATGFETFMNAIVKQMAAALEIPRAKYCTSSSRPAICLAACAQRILAHLRNAP